VTPLSFRLTRWPARPENETTAFWPADRVLTVTGAPPGAIPPDASGGTSYKVSVAEPASMPCGSTRIEYIPDAGSLTVSSRPPFLPNRTGCVRPGIDSFNEQQGEVPIVTPLAFTATR
jgi:hypothetical protein